MLCDRIAVMSARPGLIKEIVTVDVPRPRAMKSMRDPDFATVYGQDLEPATA